MTTETIVRPKRATKTDERTRQMPPYNVVLLNDDDHTYEYVIRMLGELFAYSEQKAYLMAKEVDNVGRVIVLTTTKEHAELKRDQIHAYGPDPLLERSAGSMTAVIEPVED
jgi:ATP-dependent Clp protease adaptor protein ClpS